MYAEAVIPSLYGIERALHLLGRIREGGREDLLDGALAPDMFDCGLQLRTVGIFALRSTYTLTGQDWPRDMLGQDFPEGAAGIEARLRLAGEQIKALTPADFEGAQQRTIQHLAGQAMVSQPGDVYLRLFALPNLWFHLSMAFAVARAGGLEIGKADFDGWHEYDPDFRFGG